jgi:hypothetical protein
MLIIFRKVLGFYFYYYYYYFVFFSIFFLQNYEYRGKKIEIMFGLFKEYKIKKLLQKDK